MRKASIRYRLIRSFSLIVLGAWLLIAAVGVWMIRQQVFAQAQAQVTSDLSSAIEIYGSHLERLRDTIRVHATRMVLYGALDRGDRASPLGEEMERILRTEHLDVLTLTDPTGKVFYRTRNPSSAGEDQSMDPVVSRVLRTGEPVASTEIVPEGELARESPELAAKALMEITWTPRAAPTLRTRVVDGMMLKVAAPVVTPSGRRVGVLYAGVLLNRNYEVVDKVRTTVFKQGLYKGRELGTATIFQDDVRISTNVRNADGSRAITTRVSSEVADAVLGRGETFRGRAFVVNDWYLSAYTPIRNLDGRTIGILYVGALERPYIDSLWRSLLVFLGIGLAAVVAVSALAVGVAGRISRPIVAMAKAAEKVAQGDLTQKVAVTTRDEVGYLSESFNRMTSELEKDERELREWGENLERKVEERTAQLRAMQNHLIQAEKLAAIGKLAAGVAHEINNPLTGVLTNSSLLLEDLPDGDARREDLQTIVQETLRCRKIVKGLLDFARQTQPQKTAVNLNAIAEDTLALVRNQAAFRRITVRTELDSALPTIMADRSQMQQVVLNVVLNAAEAMPEGGEICVRSAFDADARAIELSVVDTGPGIPEEIRDKLFEPFFTTKATGTGLGLSIAYGIVERHRGSIRIECPPGRGTTISIVLPIGTGEADE